MKWLRRGRRSSVTVSKMIEKTALVIADGYTPYRNQAVEEYLMREAEPKSCTMYLWQNRQTVVIGRNQNGRAECRVEQLEKDGGYLARRLSGGGAVFHDLGNLNFSFLAADPDYDVARQLRVILAAVRSFGLAAEASGRNDITIDGRKFSGNAFMSSARRRCHHGTLLISADTSRMVKYLNVAQDKLENKGVRSVRSRVVNLSELESAITVESMTAALRSAFCAEYGVACEERALSELDGGRLRALTEKFASAAWRLESEPDFLFTRKKRFVWGGAEVHLKVEAGRVAEVRLFTDSMDPELSETAEKALRGAEFSSKALCGALAELPCEEARKQMLLDISSILMEAE